MSIKRYYTCDLCGADLKDSNGIALYHHTDGKITAKYLASDGCGHHLCNSCVKGLRGMLADLDRLDAVNAARRA